MKKWQIWTLISVGLVVIIGIAGGLYWWLTLDGPAEVKTVTQSAEQKELTEVKAAIDEADDLDLAEVDNSLKELESIDLSGI